MEKQIVSHRRMRPFVRIAAGALAILLIGWTILSVSVQVEGSFRVETLHPHAGALKALVLYHPSIDAHLSDDLSLSIADGLSHSGFQVDRMTMTKKTPTSLSGYALVAIVSNTYYWRPDLPTSRYIARASLRNIPVIAVIGGAGSTVASENALRTHLTNAGVNLLATRSYWLLRPNDKRRMQEPNRAVAQDMARAFADSIGLKVQRCLAPIIVSC